MIGMDLRSDTKYYNNIYKGTKNYSSAHFEPTPRYMGSRVVTSI